MKALPLLVAVTLGLGITAAAGLDRKQAVPGDATGTRTDERAGESAAGKSSPGGPTQNQDNPGRAAQITGSASGVLSLPQKQREKIATYISRISRNRIHRVDDANFSIAVGQPCRARPSCATCPSRWPMSCRAIPATSTSWCATSW